MKEIWKLSSFVVLLECQFLVRLNQATTQTCAKVMPNICSRRRPQYSARDESISCRSATVLNNVLSRLLPFSTSTDWRRRPLNDWHRSRVCMYVMICILQQVHSLRRLAVSSSHFELLVVDFRSTKREWIIQCAHFSSLIQLLFGLIAQSTIGVARHCSAPKEKEKKLSQRHTWATENDRWSSVRVWTIEFVKERSLKNHSVLFSSCYSLSLHFPIAQLFIFLGSITIARKRLLSAFDQINAEYT